MANKCKTCGQEINEACDWNQGRCPYRVEKEGTAMFVWLLFMCALVGVIVVGKIV